MLRLPQQHTGLGTDLTFEVPHWKVFPTEEDNSSTFQIFFKLFNDCVNSAAKIFNQFLDPFFFLLDQSWWRCNYFSECKGCRGGCGTLLEQFCV